MPEPTNAELATKIDALHDTVIEVKGLAKETNGRVRRLEAWRVGIDMLVKVQQTAQGARRAVTLGLASAAAGGLVTYVLSQIIHH